MNKIKLMIRKNYKLYIGIIIGIVLSSISVYATSKINSSDVLYNNESSKLSSTNVQGAIDEIAKESKTNCPEGYICIKNIEVGDYIKMTPTSTSYVLTTEMTGYDYPNQTINPSKLNLWVVTKVNNDGTYEMASYYVSENITFYGKKGYDAYLDTLNKVAKQYMNSNYLISTRYYDGKAEKAYSIGTTTAQSYFYPDQSSTLGSTGYTEYRLAYVAENGNIGSNGGKIVYQSTSAPISNPTSSFTMSGGFRIIATVKSENSMIGSGTLADPYVLN